MKELVEVGSGIPFPTSSRDDRRPVEEIGLGVNLGFKKEIQRGGVGVEVGSLDVSVVGDDGRRQIKVYTTEVNPVNTVEGSWTVKKVRDRR